MQCSKGSDIKENKILQSSQLKMLSMPTESKQSHQVPSIVCPRNNQIFFSVRTETNPNSICFDCFSVCFAKPKNIFFGLFRCFGLILKQPKQTQLCRNKPNNLQKKFILGGPRNSKFFFLGSNRNSVCFGCF
jgi:hypothetical protein